MNKKIYFLPLILILFSVGLTSCNSARHYMKNGEYDLAVKTAVRKLKRNKNNEKNLKVLKEAYPKAVEKDSNQIAYQIKVGAPDRWDKIVSIYQNMINRQSMVEALYPLTFNGKELKFPHRDWTGNLNMAKAKAAEYHYAHGKMLMAKKDKFAYRQAFDDFQKVTTYSNNYDVSDLMDSCYELGQSYVILVVVNSSRTSVPRGYLVNLINFPTDELNSFWIKYFTQDDHKHQYDVSVNITLTNIAVSPNQITTKETTETKKVKDGWEYKLDANGNKVLDSAGNPIKIPQYTTISCKVYEHRQFKQAHIDGAINYIDTRNNTIALSIPIAADHNFEHSFYTYKGDYDALSNATRARLREREAPFPDNADMLDAVNESLKNIIYKALMDNKDFVEENF